MGICKIHSRKGESKIEIKLEKYIICFRINPTTKNWVKKISNNFCNAKHIIYVFSCLFVILKYLFDYVKTRISSLPWLSFPTIFLSPEKKNRCVWLYLPAQSPIQLLEELNWPLVKYIGVSLALLYFSPRSNISSGKKEKKYLSGTFPSVWQLCISARYSIIFVSNRLPWYIFQYSLFGVEWEFGGGRPGLYFSFGLRQLSFFNSWGLRCQISRSYVWDRRGKKLEAAKKVAHGVSRNVSDHHR